MARTTTQDGPHPVDRHVGRRARERRLSLGYGQKDVAQALGLTFQQVQKYERGANRISASKLWDMAGFLGVGIDYFFDGYSDAAPGVAEPATPFDHGPVPSRHTVQIVKLAPRLSLARQKLACEILSGMVRNGDPD